MLSIPLDCRLVIFICMSEEVAAAETLLRNFSNEESGIAQIP